MREFIKSGENAAHPEVSYTVHAYVDLAKRILLEHRVRDFTAADVVALAGIMEQRDREMRILSRAGGEQA